MADDERAAHETGSPVRGGDSRDGTGSYAALLAVPSIPRLFAGIHLARIAQSMTSVTLVLFTLSTFGSAPLAGIVAFAAGFPVVIAGPVAGALLDRHGRTRLVLLDYVVAGATLVLVAGLASAGLLAPWLLVAIAAVGALTAPLSLTGTRSLLPLIVPHQLWERANAFDSAGYVVATLVGPPCAGAIVQLAGPIPALASVCAVYLAAAASVAGVHDPPVDARARGSLRADVRAGIAYTWRNPTLRGLAFAVSTANVAWGMTAVAVPLIVLGRLHGGAAAVGVAFAIQGIGGVLAAVLAGRIDSRGRERRMIALPLVGTAAALAVLLPDAGWLPVALSLGLMGLLNGPIDIARVTLRQRRTDPAWLGRAFAVSMSVNWVGIPVGSALTGLLATQSVELAVAVAAGCTMLGAVFAQTMIPESDTEFGTPADPMVTRRQPRPVEAAD